MTEFVAPIGLDPVPLPAGAARKAGKPDADKTGVPRIGKTPSGYGLPLAAIAFADGNEPRSKGRGFCLTMLSMKEPCPFKVGDTVYYRPSPRRYHPTMRMPADPPAPGEAVRIKMIIDGKYVLYEGCKHASGAIYWNEFSPIP